MLSLISDNKLASAGAVSSVVGVILLISASMVPKVDSQGNENEEGMSKKKTFNALGGSLLAVGVLIGIFDQYTKRFGGGDSSFDMSSSEMSSADLESFQERVAAAASNLRKSMDEAAASSSSMYGGEESSAELAARASAQISSFIQNYS